MSDREFLQVSLSIILFVIWLLITWSAKDRIALVNKRDDRVLCFIALMIIDVMVIQYFIGAWSSFLEVDRQVMVIVDEAIRSLLFIFGLGLIISWALGKGRKASGRE